MLYAAAPRKPFAAVTPKVYIMRCRDLQGLIKNQEEEQETFDK